MSAETRMSLLAQPDNYNSISPVPEDDPMSDWYDNIEEPIRPLVRLLRNNGFNTFCSCGHEMWVELDLKNDLSIAEDLARFLQAHGYKKFKIDAELFAGDCLWVRRAHVTIGKWPI